MAASPTQPDLRSQVAALLAGSQPRTDSGSQPRRKPHPLYGPAAAGSAAWRGSGGGGSQPSSARRSRSQPPSPIALSKSQSRRGSAARPATSTRRRGTPASAGASPTKPAVRQASQHGTGRPCAHTGAPALLASLPSSLSTQQRLPGSPSQLLDFGRLRIASAGSTPQASPRPQQPATAGATAAAARAPACASQQWQPAAGPQALQPPCNGEEDWSIPASPEIWWNQQGAAAAAAPGLLPLSSTPGLGWQEQQQQLPHEWPAHPTGPAPPPPPPPAVAAGAGVSSSLFNSSQEWRQEVALLSEMAAEVGGTWSSQEEGEVAPTQPVEHPWQHAGTGAAASPAAVSAAATATAGAASQAGGGSQVQGLASQQPYVCSLTSQEVSELDDPWSQPESAEEEAQRQRQDDLEQQQAAALVQAQEQAQGLEEAQRDDGLQAPASPTAARQPLYPEFATGMNQWAAVGRQGQPPQQQQQQQQQQQPSCSGGSRGGVPLSPGEQQRRRERQEQEDQLVAGMCRAPALHEVRDSFALQREAFAAADWHNQRWMPLLPQPAVVMSQVPQSELLPTSSASSGQQGARTTASSASSGTTGSTVGAAAVHGGGQPGGAQEADSAAQPPQQQQQQQQPQAADFMTRFHAGLLPPADSAGYNMVPLAPLLKKQRSEEDEVAAAVRREQQEAARQAYAAKLRELQEAAAGAAAAAAATAQQQQQQPQQAGAAAGSSERAGGPAQQAAAAAAAAGAAVERQHEEGVRVFCVERRGRNGVFYRTFTAASYPAVWSVFRGTRCEARHWYEVIREGRPAHLYFDLEYPAQLNPQADGDALVECLLGHVAAQLRRHYGLALDPRCVYELDSSTPAKFSRHLTVRLPGHAFANNHAMGKFVLAASGSELAVVRGEAAGQPQLGSLVDMAVYSKNRHWRMSFCCKGGKAAVLRPTRRYATAPAGAGPPLSTAHVFLDTLVCNVEPRARLLQMPDPLPTGGGAGRGSGPLAAAVVGHGGARVVWKHDASDAAELPSDQRAEVTRLAEAALPFIERVATQRAGGAQARARTLALCGSGATVAYSMIGPGSQYCENVGRPHASNHVYFVADFCRGVYAQKCHDPDCARFRSGWMPLPPNLCLPGAGAGPSPQGSSRRSGSSAGRQQGARASSRGGAL